MKRNRGTALLMALLAVMIMGFVVMVDSSAGDDEDTTRKSVEKPEKEKSDDPETELATFMRKKLNASSQVLEGLCTEDFQAIIEGATRLHDMSQAEHWRVSTDVMYRQHSAELRGAVGDVLKAARKKNLDGAALAWTRTTFSCIECHRWVRATLISQN